MVGRMGYRFSGSVASILAITTVYSKLGESKCSAWGVSSVRFWRRYNRMTFRFSVGLGVRSVPEQGD